MLENDFWGCVISICLSPYIPFGLTVFPLSGDGDIANPVVWFASCRSNNYSHPLAYSGGFTVADAMPGFSGKCIVSNENGHMLQLQIKSVCAHWLGRI